ncbi:hypothetical protein KE3_0917 [Streptococcus lutetiensis 033]|uniref:Uncharacterized protein n=1 Tax=Streptococcus lutetiensis 033 TaxID=1076934 RepID=A0AB33ALB9_9STRE|nr:hypothetical protein KE3_0917 [Streptococcus lutetiensis 033]
MSFAKNEEDSFEEYA